jgi:hypothetical protein
VKDGSSRRKYMAIKVEVIPMLRLQEARVQPVSILYDPFPRCVLWYKNASACVPLKIQPVTIPRSAINRTSSCPCGCVQAHTTPVLARCCPDYTVQIQYRCWRSRASTRQWATSWEDHSQRIHLRWTGRKPGCIRSERMDQALRGSCNYAAP